MEFVDIYVNRRAFGHAYMRDDVLEAVLTPRGRRRSRLADCQGCPHERVVQAFAHRRSRDEHWPIAYCVDCFGIVAGLDPLVRARQPRWKFDERNLIVDRWTTRMAEARSAAVRRSSGNYRLAGRGLSSFARLGHGMVLKLVRRARPQSDRRRWSRARVPLSRSSLGSSRAR